MFDRFRGIFDVLSRIGGLGGNLSDQIAIGRELFGVLTSLPERGDIRGYHHTAIGLLEVVAPRTETQIDDGALIALRALERDAEWIAFLEHQIAQRDALPEGVLAITVTPDFVAPRVEAMNLGGGGYSSLLSLLPLIIDLIRALRNL